MMNIFQSIGKISIFIFRIIGPVSLRRIFSQIISLGLYSVSLIAVTSLFIGFVLVLQSHYAFSRTGIDGYIGSVVILGLSREIGPVIIGMVLSGRVGGSIAAEIGSMKITEQLDAMKMLNVNEYHYLVQPRVIASVIIFPVLFFISLILGMIGGYFCIQYLHLSSFDYIDDALTSIKQSDIYIGIIKSMTFGFITSIISCYKGFHTKVGSNGVGFAVTQTVIVSSIVILMINSIYTWLFMEI